MTQIKDLPIAELDAPLSAALNKIVASSTRAGAKVLHQPAYILHSYPHSETSLLLDVFTRHHGRLLIMAKGAKRPYTRWRASLFQSFQTLSIGFSGKGNVRTLLDAEWVGGIPLLPNAAMISGYYMNEWLMRSLAQADAHVGLFDAYQRALAQLSLHAHRAMEQGEVLRQFELALLTELGFAPDFSSATDVTAVYQFNAAQHRFELDAGVHGADTLRISGQSIADIRVGQFHSAHTQNEARMLFQTMLAQYVTDKPLRTRQLARELQQLQQDASKESA